MSKEEKTFASKKYPSEIEENLRDKVNSKQNKKLRGHISFPENNEHKEESIENFDEIQDDSKSIDSNTSQDVENKKNKKKGIFGKISSWFGKKRDFIRQSTRKYDARLGRNGNKKLSKKTLALLAGK